MRLSGRAKLLKTNTQRSLLMGRVRRSGTHCELTLRKALHRAGYRYRLASGTALPGTPDLVLSRFKVAIFVDGCFWHGCEKHGSQPKTNTPFWKAKIAANQRRDQRVDLSLQRLGWNVIRVWEHDISRNLPAVLTRINNIARRTSRAKL